MRVVSYKLRNTKDCREPPEVKVIEQMLPQKEPTLLTPWFRSSGLPNSREQISTVLSHLCYLVIAASGNKYRFVTAVLRNKCKMLLAFFSHDYTVESSRDSAMCDMVTDWRQSNCENPAMFYWAKHNLPSLIFVWKSYISLTIYSNVLFFKK